MSLDPVERSSTPFVTPASTPEAGEDSYGKQLTKGYLDLENITHLPSGDFTTCFEHLREKCAEGDFSIQLEGVKMPIEITESPILEGGAIRTQIQDPLYKEELLKHKDEKHYSIKLRDPHHTPSPEWEKAKKEWETLQVAMGKMEELKPLSKTEEELVSSLVNKHGDIADAMMMVQVEFESLNAEFEKPAISIRFSEKGDIGEIASVAVHSKELPGQKLMEGIGKLCTALGVKKMFLEDDAKIESPSGSYNLRLFRYFIGKNSWYEDSFGFRPYYHDGLHATLMPQDNASRDILKIPISQFGGLKLGKISQLLSSPDIERGKAKELISLLSTLNENKTLSEAIYEMGNKIIKDKAPLHKELNTLLVDLLESFASYRGQDTEMLELKKGSTSLLNEKFLIRNYS